MRGSDDTEPAFSAADRDVQTFRRGASAILTFMEMQPATRSSARDAMDELHRNGSPVVEPETADDVIEIGWRRWHSFERRNRKAGWSQEQQLEDLAKGLRDAFEPDRRLVGPLMEDYRQLASSLGRALMASSATSRSGP